MRISKTIRKKKKELYRRAYESWWSLHYKKVPIVAEWAEFHTFYLWFLPRYKKNSVLCVADPEKPHGPENSYFGSRRQQANKRFNNLIWRGKTLAEWCKELGLNYHTAYSRLRRGYDVQSALYDPIQKKEV